MAICNIAQMRVFYIQSVMGAEIPVISDPPCSLRSTPGASDPPLGAQRLERQIHPWIFRSALEPRIQSWSLRSIVQPQMDSPLALEPHRSTPGVSDPPLEPQTPGSPPLEPQIHPWSRFQGWIRGSRWSATGGTLPAVERSTRGGEPQVIVIPCSMIFASWSWRGSP